MTKNLNNSEKNTLDQIIEELNAKYNFDTRSNPNSTIVERFLGTSNEKLEDIESEYRMRKFSYGLWTIMDSTKWQNDKVPVEVLIKTTVPSGSVPSFVNLQIYYFQESQTATYITRVIIEFK